MRHAAWRGVFAGALALWLATASEATVLTFEPVGLNGSAIDLRYGSRVTAAEQDGFLYGSAGGFTPNIVVEYGPVPSDVHRWSDRYGDLRDVIYREAEGAGILTVTFRADPGFLVVLHRFDLGGWPDTDYVINGVRVLDGDGRELFVQTSAPIRGATGVPRHTASDFGAAPLVAPVLTIHVDSRNLGDDSDNIGLDNIEFSQRTAGPGRFALELACPTAARPGTTVSAGVTFRNDTGTAYRVTRRAEGIHAGGLRFTGPRAVGMDVSVPAGGAPVSDSIPLVIPSTVRPRELVTVGVVFLGQIGNSATRRRLGAAHCVVPIVP